MISHCDRNFLVKSSDSFICSFVNAEIHILFYNLLVFSHEYKNRKDGLELFLVKRK